MVLRPSDNGYLNILGHYEHENFPTRFNYQNFFWTKETEDGVIIFRRGQPIESFTGKGNEDRPGLLRHA